MSTITDIARTFARHTVNGDNSEKRLSEHADFPEYVRQASLPKSGKASPIVAAAKALLGVTDTRGTKTGPAGQQVWTKFDDDSGMTGQHVENVAKMLKRHMEKATPTVALRVTWNGENKASGTIDPKSELGKMVLAHLASAE